MHRRPNSALGWFACALLLAACGDSGTTGAGGGTGTGGTGTGTGTGGEGGTTTTTTTTGPTCGDGNVDTSEECDGANLNGQDCVGLGFDTGTLSCDGSCGFDASQCTTFTCGDGTVNDPMEACDGADLAGQDCAALGYDGGTLACTANCQFEESGCADEDCYNAVDDDFDTTVDCNDSNCAGVCADSCSAPPVLTDGATVNGDTTGHSALYAESCGSGTSGPEVVYQLTVTITGMLDLTLDSAADLGISTLTSCASGETSCTDDDDGGIVEHASIPVTMGDTVYIMVDGFTATDMGPYTLTAASRPIVCGDGLLEGGELCDDGNMADGDGCSSTCVFECAFLDCNDNNACTVDTCDATQGCSTTPVNPDDGNACTTDSCDPTTGVAHTPIDINDSNACTTDACDPTTGIITHTPAAITSDGNGCTTDSCNPANGQPVHTYIPGCCAHSLCVADQSPLNAAACTWQPPGTNDDCATQVCSYDSFCCSNGWDAICVNEAKNPAICFTGLTPSAYTCACTHSYCTSGAALTTTCDPCVKKICEADSYCCNNAWDATCVAETNSICHVPAGAACK